MKMFVKIQAFLSKLLSRG